MKRRTRDLAGAATLGVTVLILWILILLVGGCAAPAMVQGPAAADASHFERDDYVCRRLAVWGTMPRTPQYWTEYAKCMALHGYQPREGAAQ